MSDATSSLETFLANHPQLAFEIDKSADGELAGAIRGVVALLNTMVERAARRELIVTYRIKEGVKSDGLTNPRIIVSVTTEVI